MTAFVPLFLRVQWRHAVRLAFTHKDIRAFLHINTKLLLSFSLLNFHTSLDQNIIFFCRFLATANYNRELFRWGQSQKMQENKWKCFNGLKEKILSKEHAFYTSADAFTVLTVCLCGKSELLFLCFTSLKRVDRVTHRRSFLRRRNSFFVCAISASLGRGGKTCRKNEKITWVYIYIYIEARTSQIKEQKKTCI